VAVSLSNLHCGRCHARFCIKCDGTGIAGPVGAFGRCKACDGKGFQKDKTEMGPDDIAPEDILCKDCRKELHP